MSSTFAIGLTALLATAAATKADYDKPRVLSQAMLKTMKAKQEQWAALDHELAQSRQKREGPMECVNGMAGEYSCSRMNLLGHIPLAELGGLRGNDIWGWTAPNGREFALAGCSDGTSFVDIDTMEVLGFLRSTDGVVSSWRDIKVVGGHYAVIVSEATGHGLQIYDLNDLLDMSPGLKELTPTAHHTGFGSAHNVVVNEETDMVYVVGATNCAGGLYMLDMKDPLNPEFVGCFAADGYTHDAECVIYKGPDANFQGKEICFNYNEDTLTIVDVTDRENVVQLSRTTYVGAEYTHQGWLTSDHKYVLMDDELDQAPTGTKTLLWDVSDLTNPVHFDTYLHKTNAIAHNLYTVGDVAYCANYNAGLQVIDISTIKDGRANNIKQVAHFDVFPENDDHLFSGMWSNYPYFPSGKVVGQSIPGGLFVFEPLLDTPVCEYEGTTPWGECSVSCGEGMQKRQTVLKPGQHSSCPPTDVEVQSCNLGECPPDCNDGCAGDMIGDGVCQAACNVDACNMDNGDCLPRCNDGIHNGDEEQRDCGGSCPACGANCPWLDVTDHPDMLGCADGTQCNRTALGWGCCVGEHGGRAQCPPTHPNMCARNFVCGGGQDYCCSPTIAGCDSLDGLRQCRAVFFNDASGVCRLSASDRTHDGNGTATVVAGEVSKEECQERCADSDSCTGVEWGIRGRCEMWTVPIQAVGPSPGSFTCSMKGTNQ